MRRTSILILFLVSILLGLVAGKFIQPISAWLYISVIFIPWAYQKKILVIFILCGLAIGAIRASEFNNNLSMIKQLNKQQVTLIGYSANDAIYNDKAQLQFDIQNATINNQPIKGNFQISGFGESAIFRGDLISAQGKLYVTRGSHQAGISFANISKISSSHSAIFDISRKFSAGLQNSLPEPQSSFALGLLIGQRTSMPKEILDILIATSLIHIVAVSGFNVTILANGAKRIKITRSKFQKLCLSAVLISLFILITGFSASIVRAGIVSGFSLWAWYYGRTIRPLLLISLAASITALWNPYYLWSDVGWYLSFLAFFGILVLSPAIVSKIQKTNTKNITKIFIETLSAQLMTTPLILYIFGRFSIIGIIANLLIVPLVPAAMLLSLMAGLTGIFYPFSSHILAWPAKILLTYMLDVSHIFAQLPFASKQISINIFGLVFLYFLIVLIIFTIHKSTSVKNNYHVKIS